MPPISYPRTEGASLWLKFVNLPVTGFVIPTPAYAPTYDAVLRLARNG
jgi:hypothetical protein